jgi:hypothetical protein
VGQDGLLHHRLKVYGTFVFTPEAVKCLTMSKY